MADLSPLYTSQNCTSAYQLNWAISLFGNDALPPSATWLDPLQQTLQADGVRILEHRSPSANVLQFLASTRPILAPSDLLRLLKGRLQYALRRQQPRAFRRNYRLESVGSARGDRINQYIGQQLSRHHMADARVEERLRRYQFHQPDVDLHTLRYSAHGQFLYNLHLVIKHEDGWSGIEEAFLTATRDMIVGICRKRGFLLSRAGIVADHVHFAVGCGIQDSPQAVALCFLNNLAYAHGMRPVYKFGFYVGTFGNFDLGALRHAQKASGGRE